MLESEKKQVEAQKFTRERDEKQAEALKQAKAKLTSLKEENLKKSLELNKMQKKYAVAVKEQEFQR